VHRRHFPTAAKLERGVTEFDTYIRNTQKFIPNFGERYRQGDTISTAFVESTINQAECQQSSSSIFSILARSVTGCL
jgi:hypothetical protein